MEQTVFASADALSAAGFVAINTIRCRPEYRPRFEELFSTRAHAIDRLPGFIGMQVLKPVEDQGEYLIVSYWRDGESFSAWRRSPEFLEGHSRGFDDLRAARDSGQGAPMVSSFRTYSVLSR